MRTENYSISHLSLLTFAPVDIFLFDTVHIWIDGACARAAEKRGENPFAVIFDSVISNHRFAAALAGDADKRNVFGYVIDFLFGGFLQIVFAFGVDDIDQRKRVLI